MRSFGEDLAAGFSPPYPLSSPAMARRDGRRLGEGGMPTRERFPLRQAYGGTGRPDRCLVVKSLDSSLRPVCPSQHGIHRHHHQGVEGNDPL
jgi:hypothetical protein